MTDQLLYNGLRATVSKGYALTRGDTKQLVFPHDLGPASAVKEARLFARLQESPFTAVIQSSMAEDPDLWDFSTDYQGIFTFTHAKTKGVAIAELSLGVELVDLSDRVYTVVAGTLDLGDDIVHDDDSAAYLSYMTLEKLTANFNSLLAHVSATLTTAASSIGATTITVEDASFINATDTVWIETDDGTYDSPTVSSKSGNTLTIGTPLTDDVSIGNVVQKGA